MVRNMKSCPLWASVYGQKIKNAVPLAKYFPDKKDEGLMFYMNLCKVF